VKWLYQVESRGGNRYMSNTIYKEGTVSRAELGCASYRAGTVPITEKGLHQVQSRRCTRHREGTVPGTEQGLYQAQGRDCTRYNDRDNLDRYRKGL
jgi:hypothetical protein